MICLVTGASGFIGQVLCQTLQAQHRIVRAVMRNAGLGPWNEVCIADLATNSTALTDMMQGVDTVFHLAGLAHSYATPAEYLAVNVRGTENVLLAAAKMGVKHFVYFSSSKAIDPTDEYGRSKQTAEKRVLDLSIKHGIQVCILRPTLVYGPHLKGNLARMLRAIDQGWLPPPPETGNRRSMVSIDDVVSAALLVEKHPHAAGKCFVLSDNEAYSTRKVYDMMRAALGMPARTWSIPVNVLRFVIKTLLRKPNVYEKLMGSSEYTALDIQQTLGWMPKYNLYQMLPKIVQAYRDNNA